MLEFRLTCGKQVCEITEIVYGYKKDDIRVYPHVLKDGKFTSDWHRKYHQDKIDALMPLPENAFYVSGDASMRGNGIHYE